MSRGVIVQGLTGRAARIHAKRMKSYGTNIAAGVVPGKAGQMVDGVPIHNTVQAAMDATGALTSMVFLPGQAAGDGLLEAAEAGIRLAVCVTEGVETHDLLPALALARICGMTIIGPNTPGILVPGGPLLGFLPTKFARPGSCAVLSKSGTLSYEAVWELNQAGLGLSLWLVVGGDSVKGTRFSDVIPYLAQDQRTRAIVVIGEIGGTDEEDAAIALSETQLPTVALIAGRRAPPERATGHAGAIIAGSLGQYVSKADALRASGATVALRPSELPVALRQMSPSLEL